MAYEPPEKDIPGPIALKRDETIQQLMRTLLRRGVERQRRIAEFEARSRSFDSSLTTIKADVDARFELALIDYAFDNRIDLLWSDWRTVALERLARTHPELQPRPRRGRPKDRYEERPGVASERDRIGTPSEWIKLPQPFGKAPIGPFIGAVDEARARMRRRWEATDPQERSRYSNTDKMVAEIFARVLNPDLPEGPGLNAKVRGWQNAISRARKRWPEITK